MNNFVHYFFPLHLEFLDISVAFNQLDMDTGICPCYWYQAQTRQPWFVRYLRNSRAGVSAHCLNAFGIKHRLGLLQGLIHVSHVALLSLQDAGQVDLNSRRTVSTSTHSFWSAVCRDSLPFQILA